MTRLTSSYNDVVNERPRTPIPFTSSATLVGRVVVVIISWVDSEFDKTVLEGSFVGLEEGTMLQNVMVELGLGFALEMRHCLMLGTGRPW